MLKECVFAFSHTHIGSESPSEVNPQMEVGEEKILTESSLTEAT